MVGDADPERAGQAAELERRVEQQGLAVHPRLDRSARLDREPVGLPARPAAEPVQAARPLGGEEADDVPGAAEVDRRDAELAGVEAGPAAEPGEGRQPVGVVGHLDDPRAVPTDAIGADEVEVERLRSGTHQVGQHRGGRPALGLAVLRRSDDLGVHPEGHVVDEDPPVHRAQVDAPLDRRVEGVEGGDDVVAVQPEVEGEAVASAGGDAHEGHIGRHRHAGHQRLRSVPARHADHVRAPVDRTLGQLEQVVPGLEDHRLDAASAALLGQREPLRLAPTGPRVHDEDPVAAGPTWRPGGGCARSALRIAAQRVADEDGGPGEQREHDDEAQAVALRGQHHDDDERRGARRWRSLATTRTRPRAGDRDPCHGRHQQEQQRASRGADPDRPPGRRPRSPPRPRRAPVPRPRRPAAPAPVDRWPRSRSPRS